MFAPPPAERLPGAQLTAVDVTQSITGVIQTATDATLDTRNHARAQLKLRFGRIHLNVLDGESITVRGALLPARPGRKLTLELLTRRGWRTRAHAYTEARGRFALRYLPRGLHSARLEVRYAGDSRAVAVRRVLGRFTVFRLVGASWYGGGGSLACGGYLTSSTMGVANKTLPCGTLVTLRYGGRSVRVPVVDRGPYVSGREFDLTEATSHALGFEGVGQVWSSR